MNKKYYIIIAAILFLIIIFPAWRKNSIDSDRYDIKPLKSFDSKTYDINNSIDYSYNKIIVKFKSNINLNDRKKVLKYTGFSEYKKLFGNYYLLKNKRKIENIKEFVNKIKNLSGVENAEPDYLAYMQTTPNDPYFKYQYYLHNYGQTLVIGEEKIKVKSGADIEAESAWDYTQGSDDLIVAVVDTGADYSHPDLRAKLLEGYNFVVGNPYPIDDNGHGTEMAGIIGATTNNNLGVSGICWNCKILPVKVLDKNGVGTYSAIALGIRYAVDHGAKIINLSLGGENPSFILEDAVKYAYEKGVAVFASTGNEHKEGVLYPAAYTSYVLAIAATDYNDKKLYISNYGPEVCVAAPGKYILTTTLKGKYAYVTGTSPAAAVVSGIAGLVLSQKGFLSPSDLYKVIKYAAEDVNSKTDKGVDIYLGYGRVNAENTVAPIELE